MLEPTKSKMPRTDHQSSESPINPAFMPDFPTWEEEHSNFTQKRSFLLDIANSCVFFAIYVTQHVKSQPKTCLLS